MLGKPTSPLILYRTHFLHTVFAISSTRMLLCPTRLVNIVRKTNCSGVKDSEKYNDLYATENPSDETVAVDMNRGREAKHISSDENMFS